MSTTPRTNVSKPSRDLINTFRTDMFGRTKISEPFTIFDSQHRYQENQDYSNTFAVGGSTSYNASASLVNMDVTADSGSEVTRETFRIFPYQPGKSLQVMQTFVFAPPKENLRQRAGYFTRSNGFFLEQDGTDIYFVRRTSSSGQLQEIKVPQSEWNTDRLDGSGPSDVVLDLSKAQILFSEYEWLGVGSVRLGFAIDGYFIVCHQFNHANYIDTTYMTTAALPARLEITNTGPTDSASTLKQICTTVISNGGYFRPTYQSTTIRPAETVSTAFYPLISIRMAAGRTDSVIIPTGIDLSPVDSGDFEFVLTKNSTLTGGTWIPRGPKNNVEYNITGTSMTVGQILQEGFFSSTNQSTSAVTINDNKNFSYQLGRTNAATPVSDVITIGVRTLSGAADVISALTWEDLL